MSVDTTASSSDLHVAPGFSLEASDRLWSALAVPDLAAADEALKAGADINVRNANETPLIVWAGGGFRWEALGWLLEKGVDCTATDNVGETVLHHAIRGGDLRTLDMLFPAVPHALFSQGNHAGITPVLTAVLRERDAVPAVERLLKEGISLDPLSDWGSSPLMAVVSRRGEDGVDVLKLLLASGASTHLADNEGNTFWHAWAMQHHKAYNETLVSWLQDHPEVHAELLKPNKRGVTPLAYACDTWNRDVLKACLKAGGNPNDRTGNTFCPGTTCVMHLLTEGTPARADLELCVERKASYTQRDNELTHALHYASTGVTNNFQAHINAYIKVRLQDQAHPPEQEEASPDVPPPQLPVFDVQELLWPLRHVLDQGIHPETPLSLAGDSVFTALMSLRERAHLTLKQFQESPLVVFTDMADLGLPETWWDQCCDTLRAWGFPLETKALSVPKGWLDALPAPAPSALNYALLTGDVEAFEKLVTWGADVMAIDPMKNVPAERICTRFGSKQEKAWYNHTTASLEKLLPEERLKAEEALAAFKAKNLDVIRRQVAACTRVGVGPATCTHTGRPLQHAWVESTDYDIWRDLDIAPDWNACGPEGETIFEAALLAGRAETFHALVARAQAEGYPLAKIQEAFRQAILASPEEKETRPTFLALMATIEPAWWNTPDADGNTPLLLAAATEQTDLVCLALHMGANPNRANTKGETPLMHAVASGRGEMVETLRSYGAEGDAVTLSGRTVESFIPHGSSLYVRPALTRDDPVAVKLGTQWPLSESTVTKIARSREDGTKAARPVVASRAPSPR